MKAVLQLRRLVAGFTKSKPVHDPGQVRSGRNFNPILWVSRRFPPGGKRPGREADHSSPSSAEVKNGGAIPPLPHMSSWHSA
jgi:hypothetical protein